VGPSRIAIATGACMNSSRSAARSASTSVDGVGSGFTATLYPGDSAADTSRGAAVRGEPSRLRTVVGVVGRRLGPSALRQRSSSSPPSGSAVTRSGISHSFA
jgi:hypothetical protein